MVLSVYRQKTIAILDLEKPDGPQPVRKLGRQSKFDIRVLEWNHSEENRNLLASTVCDVYMCVLVMCLIVIIIVDFVNCGFRNPWGCRLSEFFVVMQSFKFYV